MEKEVKRCIKQFDSCMSTNESIIDNTIVIDKQETKQQKQKEQEIEIDYSKQQHVKIGVIGNVDSGKTTLVGVLSKGIEDDGRGEARNRVFNFKHEMENGRTSSIAHEIMGFDAKGQQVLPERFTTNKNKYQSQVMKQSQKIVTFLDLCGHEKYLKTTTYGMVAMDPDYALLVVGSNMGVARMTKEHLGLTLALKKPLIIVLTKVDLCPLQIQQNNLQIVTKILKHPVVNRLPFVVRQPQDVYRLVQMSKQQQSQLCPIFMLSNVTKQGMHLLVQYLANITVNNNSIQQTNSQQQEQNDKVEIDIYDNFQVTGVGIVVSGLVKKGTVHINQELYLGADKQGQFIKVQIKGIHINRTPQPLANSGQFACFLIKNKRLVRKMFRKGMCLVEGQPSSVRGFQAQILVLHHSSTIKEGYQCMMHCRVIRQSVRLDAILNNNNNNNNNDNDNNNNNKANQQETRLLRTGDTSLVNFSFVYHKEYLQEGSVIIFREGRTKLQGKVVKLFYD